jgi:hypothetical protein
LVIILRGTARVEFKEFQKFQKFKEFKEFEEFEEADALLLIREDLGSECNQSAAEPGDRFVDEVLSPRILELLQLLELLELLLIRAPGLKPATEGEACLAS